MVEWLVNMVASEAAAEPITVQVGAAVVTVVVVLPAVVVSGDLAAEVVPIIQALIRTTKRV